MSASRDGSKITEEALNALRREIGVESDLPQFNHEATADAIRHFVLGRGDDNPLFCDRDYAKTTRWGDIIAPATFILTCGFPRSRGLPGVHALFTGVDIVCRKPVKLGAKIKARSALFEVKERNGQYAGKQFQQTSRTDYRDENGELLSTLYSHAFRMERGAAGKSNKFADLTRKEYSAEEIDEIDAAYVRELEERRGANPRYWNDTNVGDVLSDMVKGPLTVTDNVAFLVGFGTVFVRAHRIWHDFRKRHPGAAVKDPRGVWDVPERVHWDEELAAAIGMPGPYDYGPQRIAWIDHRVADWIGDDGWMKQLTVKLVAPNFVGDTTWIRGHVAEKLENGEVMLNLATQDQRGRTTATATARVVLPVR
ncbi:MAG: MaoC family dehydratase N-terminal domain-containing protein [Pseudomonadota bacterium]|nr:MaoC family dehydratase N-terminal domain-containing protein [Pseudomonadota bacterium]